MESKTTDSEQITQLADNLIAKVRKSLEAAKESKKCKGSIQNKYDN